jgi:hypothetical protein
MKMHHLKYLLGICRRRVNVESGFRIDLPDNSLRQEIAGILSDVFHQGLGLLRDDKVKTYKKYHEHFLLKKPQCFD